MCDGQSLAFHRWDSQFPFRYACIAYVCIIFEVLGCVNTQLIGARNEWLWMIMKANDIQGWMGPKFSFVLRLRKNPGKTSIRKTDPGPLTERQRCHPLTTAMIPNSVSPCGFSGVRNGLWVGFSRSFYPLPRTENFLQSFLHTHLILFVSIHFISP